MEAPSFASRRPAATSLPAFSLPPPDIPSTRYPAPASHPAVASPTGSPAAQNKHLAWSSATPVTTSTPASAASVTYTQPPHLVRPSVSSVLTPTSGATTDGISPLSSGINSGGSQNSQPSSNPPMYYTRVTGAWPTPTASSNYSFATNGGSHSSTSLVQQQSYSSSRSLYPAISHSIQQQFEQSGRPATSQAGVDGLAAPSYAEQSTALNPIASGGGANSQTSQTAGPSSHLSSATLSSHGSSAQNTSTNGSSTAENNYRQQHAASHTGGYYQSASSTPQQSSFPSFSAGTGPPQQSPTAAPATTVSSTAPRSSSISAGQPGTLASMAASIGYGHPANRHPPSSSYPPYAMQGNPVLSNMHHPGAPLAMVGGISAMGMTAAYGPPGAHHLSIYGHGQQPPPQDRPFKCDQCPQSFNRNHDLKRHKRIHLAVKPFPCKFCEKSFSRKDALKRHRLVKGCGEKKSPVHTDSTNAGVVAPGSTPPPDRSETTSDDTEGSPTMLKRVIT